MPRFATTIASALLPGGRLFGNRVAFTASGTFTPPTNVNSVWVTMIGGGGGGGGGSWVDDGAGLVYQTSGGGGGSGEVIYRIPVTVTPGSAVTVTVGAAGTVGSNQTTNVWNGTIFNLTATSGGNGGSSSFGAVTVTGGGGGIRGNAQTGAAGSGGGGGNNVLAIQTSTRLYADHATVTPEARWGTRYVGINGTAGHIQTVLNTPPTTGSMPAAGFFETRFTAPVFADIAGGTALPTSPGSGGSGGWDTNNQSEQAARAGIIGLVIVEY